MSETTTTRGQAEVLGFVLLVGISVIAAGAIVTAGASAFQDLRTEISTERNVNALERFDSKSAVVLLGGADAQTISLGRARHGYTVRPDAGWIRITHVNATDGGEDEVLYNETLGALVYRNEQAGIELAYQGGGVWRREGEWSRAVSPPEFHYRGKTLTLPVIQIRGSGAASGGVRATVVSTRSSVPIYPNATREYDASGRPYRNPLQNGTIVATVHSDYYRGWATYFRRQTAARVTAVDPVAETTTVELTAAGPIGYFEMPRHGNAIELRGLGDQHVVDQFEITITPDETDSAHFANMDWRLEASGPTRDLTLALFSEGKPCKGKAIDLRITYSNATTTQTWVREDAFTENATAFSYECAGEPSVHVKFTGTETLRYDEGPGTLSFDHAEDGEPATHALGDDATVNQLVNHYVALMDSDVDFVVQDRGGRGRGRSSGAVDESTSFGVIHHERTGTVVVFLRITESRARVELN
ncbi:MAG: hypothetical protein ABEJ05_00255 [Haloglomus sp.]